MAHYAVGSFERGQSGSPYQFVCKKVYPEGPFALLDIKRLRINPPRHITHLFELEDWRSIDQRKQFVTRLIAPIDDIARCLLEALRSANWEMVTVERRRRKVQIVGRVLKTEYGYFIPEYHGGLNAFGPGQDVDPWITFEPCPGSSENPYGEALGTTIAQGQLLCVDSVEIERAKQAFIATADLGELLAAKMAGQNKS